MTQHASDHETAHETDRLTTEDIARSRAEEERPGDLAMSGRHEDHDGNGHADDRDPLLPADEIDDLDHRWTRIQSDFVDEPREAVQGADALVAELMQRLATMFADEREKLEAQWSRGDEVSTEDLRLALQRYRSFFQRLLST
jgi:hypothetical protein